MEQFDRNRTLGEDTKPCHPEGINCFVTGDEAEEQKSRPLASSRQGEEREADIIAKAKIWRCG